MNVGPVPCRPATDCPARFGQDTALPPLVNGDASDAESHGDLCQSNGLALVHGEDCTESLDGEPVRTDNQYMSEELMDMIKTAVALSILNERNAEGTRFGDALMDALYQVGLGRVAPAEGWDDTLVDLVGMLVDWLPNGVSPLPDCACDVATMKLLSPMHPNRYLELACDLHNQRGGDPVSNNDWKPGDPCAVCGSTKTGWNGEQGGFCLGCGRSDSDDD